jgi:hypothetical protein
MSREPEAVQRLHWALDYADAFFRTVSKKYHPVFGQDITEMNLRL